MSLIDQLFSGKNVQFCGGNGYFVHKWKESWNAWLPDTAQKFGDT